MATLLERAGLPGNFFDMTAREDRASAARAPARASLAVLPRVLRVAWRESRAAPRIEAHVERVDRELAGFRGRDWAGTEPAELLRQADRVLALHGDSQRWVFLAALNLTARMRILQRLLDRWAPGVESGDLMRGLAGMKTLEPNAALQRLGERAARLSPEVREGLLEEATPMRAAARSVGRGSRGGGGGGRLPGPLRYLRPHGVDFSEPGWAEDPGAVWSAIGRLAVDGRATPAADPRSVGERAAASVELRLGGLRRLLFDRLLASTRRHIALRERLSLLLTEDVHETRRLFLALGEHLAAEGGLAGRDDVFFLEYPELRALVEGRAPVAPARRLVEERRAEMERDAQVELPETFAGEEPPVLPVGEAAAVGTSSPASPRAPGSCAAWPGSSSTPAR